MSTASPVIFILFFGLAAMAAGALLAWFLLSSKGDGDEVEEKPSTAEAVSETVAVAPPEGEELLSVRRVDGEVAVFVGGQRYRRLEDVRDPRLGRGAVEALKAIIAFAAGWLPLRREPQPVKPSAPAVDEGEFLEHLGQPLAAAEPVFKPPAEAIDDLIQQRLRKWPDLVDEKVRMSTAADGTLRIHVGLRIFRSVDEVPDPKVRALIKDAVREWEQSGM